MPHIDLMLEADRKAKAEYARAAALQAREAARQAHIAETKARFLAAGVVRLRWATYWENDENQFEDVAAFRAEGQAEFNPGAVYERDPATGQGRTVPVALDDPRYVPITQVEAEEFAWELQNEENGAWEYDMLTGELRTAGVMHDPQNAYVEWYQ